MRENFYGYQQRRLLLLLLWALGSMLVGVFTGSSKSAFWRQFGLQSFLWGAIDGALAAFGMIGANRKEERLALGELGAVDEQREARNFWRILAINAGLDVAYVLSGAWVWQRFRAREDRRGMGVGIVIQGLWLLFFDSVLAGEVQRRWLR